MYSRCSTTSNPERQVRMATSTSMACRIFLDRSRTTRTPGTASNGKRDLPGGRLLRLENLSCRRRLSVHDPTRVLILLGRRIAHDGPQDTRTLHTSDNSDDLVIHSGIHEDAARGAAARLDVARELRNVRR